jgi:16S rRNA G966 N2-methylase RsmD
MEILDYCIIENNGTTLRVPTQKEYSMAKEDYLQFKNLMLNIKGKWIGNQTFQFPFNATNLLSKLKNGEKVDLRKLQLFPTPTDLACSMWDYLSSEFNTEFDFEKARVLEPSAGTGNLIKYLGKVGFRNIDYCEISEEYNFILESNIDGIKANKVGNDFLKLKPTALYDLVFANPPFKSDTKHFSKMYEVTKEGGFICSLMGESFYLENCKDEFKKFSSLYAGNFFSTYTPQFNSKEKEEWVFDNTNAGFSIIIIQKNTHQISYEIVKDLDLINESSQSYTESSSIDESNRQLQLF